MTPTGAPTVIVIAARKFHSTVCGAQLRDEKGGLRVASLFTTVT
jgi:hypothetical protein